MCAIVEMPMRCWDGDCGRLEIVDSSLYSLISRKLWMMADWWFHHRKTSSSLSDSWRVCAHDTTESRLLDPRSHRWAITHKRQMTNGKWLACIFIYMSFVRLPLLPRRISKQNSSALNQQPTATNRNRKHDQYVLQTMDRVSELPEQESGWDARTFNLRHH